MFCALLEFALVNYASRSDMQRDRARERMERARRQWELEHQVRIKSGGEMFSIENAALKLIGHLLALCNCVYMKCSALSPILTFTSDYWTYKFY